jgi:hypothetical protein
MSVLICSEGERDHVEEILQAACTVVRDDLCFLGFVLVVSVLW